MKAVTVFILLTAAILVAGCVLVTEPLKVVGTAADCTVRTTDAVARAPLSLIPRQATEKEAGPAEKR